MIINHIKFKIAGWIANRFIDLKWWADRRFHQLVNYRDNLNKEFDDFYGKRL